MAESKNRIINTAFWDDDFVINLDTIEKILYLYFLTNPLTNIAGIYQISLRRIAFDTGIDLEMVKKLIGRFEEAGKVYYELGWVIIKNWIKHQSLNPKVVKGVETTLNNLPEWLREATLCDESNKLYIDFDSLSIDYDIKKRKEDKRIEVKRKEVKGTESNLRNSDWYKGSKK